MDEAILTRHAESVAGASGLVSGDPARPVGLTEEGRTQARRLGEQLAGRPIDLCVVTEFERVRETADLALAGRDVPRLAVPELNEIRYGAYDGGPFDEYLEWARAAGPEEQCPGNGESRIDVAARYVRGWRIVLARPEPSVLVVTHGLPLRYVLDALDGSDPAPVLEQVPYAETYFVNAADLARAVDRLEAWSAREPAWR